MRVSLSVAAEGGRIRVALAAFCAVLALGLATAVAPPSAHADFTIAACHGSAVKGEGSSLQATAQEQFWTQSVFYSSFGCGSGAISTSPVTYKSDGSGCGIAAIGGGPGAEATCSNFKAGTAVAGQRATETRFAASDAPLTPTQKANAEAAGGPNPGVIHEIPVAAAAVAVIVHFPEGCELEDPGTGSTSLNEDTTTGGPNDPAGKGTGDTFTDKTLRVHITAAQLEKIWDGTPTTWGEVLTSKGIVHMHNEGKDKPTSPQEASISECKNVPVRRIVRLDGSGTTYNFKAYLSLLPGAPSGLWTTAPIVGDNNVWPVTTSDNTKPPSVVSNVCTDAGNICVAGAEKGGPLATAVKETDGSISYLDLATARKEHFDIEKTTGDHTYWIPLQTINPSKANEVGTNYVEPTAVPTAHIVGNGATLGANCTEADYRNIPSTPASDPTLGDWSNAIATGSLDTVTYPDCAITYDFAFDDDAPVFGNTQIEQERARTVKDYLTAVESPTGQSGLSGADYGILPASIQQLAQNGVKAIDWNKAAGSGGSKEEVKTVSPAPKTTPPTTTILTAPPSNAFSLAGAKVKGKTIVLSLVLPDAGKVQVKAIGGGVTVSSASATVSSGSGTVTLAISKAALKKLAKVKGHKLSVKITVTFTPNGGSAASKTKTLTLTQAAVTPKKKATKGKKK
ncbi:MAG TPA: hypothetical protein VK781_13485 [Solirubrobacteraceae bacterium]|jgi:ABC-type phosphate transport system substrate-binding protein|nr:hypothetical protein [Solirubrobacteraceae bacterium]